MIEGIHCITKYYPVRVNGDRNPLFQSSKSSKMLLDLKDPANSKHSAAVEYFSTGLRNKLDEIGFDRSIRWKAAVVPSHAKGKFSSGLCTILNGLSTDFNLDVQPGLLIRTREIQKLSQGGSREAHVHHASISVVRDLLSKGDNVLLLDDIASTGNSLAVCKELLQLNGASEVIMIAIGGTCYA